MRFENRAGAEGQVAIGAGGMAEQLITSLVKSGRFIVLERQALQDIVGEQQFGMSGMVKQETAIRMGEIESPEFLVYGAVTSFKGDHKGTGAGVGVGRGAGLGATLGGAVAPMGGGSAVGALLGGLLGAAASHQQAHVAIDLRIVDAKTGRVVNATSVEGTPQSAGARVGVAPGEVAFGVSGFYNTPIGQAVRDVIDKTVDWIVKNAFAEASVPAPVAGLPQAPRPAPASPPSVALYSVTGAYNLRETPNGKIITALQAGTQVAVVEMSGEWSRVQLQDGKIGWIISRALKKVEAPAIPQAPQVQAVTPPQPSLAAPVAAQPQSAPSDLLYMFREGDSLGSIAASLTGSEANWPKLAEYNRITDPSRLSAGQVIRIPGSLLLEKFRGK
jgi:curli biogenesis system outer membrane secretion channel CsgG